MLIPRNETSCFEAVLETIEPGRATPPNAHITFVQMYFFVGGNARVHIGGEMSEVEGPAVAYVPKQAQHYVQNIGNGALTYIYVSIWPGEIPPVDGRTWREASELMIKAYDSQRYSPRHS